jgi:transposase
VREEIRALRREVFELRRANEIVKSASGLFATELDADRTR